jgi:hypothetical protein
MPTIHTRNPTLVKDLACGVGGVWGRQQRLSSIGTGQTGESQSSASIHCWHTSRTLEALLTRSWRTVDALLLFAHSWRTLLLFTHSWRTLGDLLEHSTRVHSALLKHSSCTLCALFEHSLRALVPACAQPQPFRTPPNPLTLSVGWMRRPHERDRVRRLSTVRTLTLCKNIHYICLCETCGPPSKNGQTCHPHFSWPPNVNTYPTNPNRGWIWGIWEVLRPYRESNSWQNEHQTLFGHLKLGHPTYLRPIYNTQDHVCATIHPNNDAYRTYCVYACCLTHFSALNEVIRCQKCHMGHGWVLGWGCSGAHIDPSTPYTTPMMNPDIIEGI